jgi:hypothetical protein
MSVRLVRFGRDGKTGGKGGGGAGDPLPHWKSSVPAMSSVAQLIICLVFNYMLKFKKNK